ncbi:MAG TPA: Wzz/FepE/Etk N-terminal domain-containing protein, partial [Verrucomicrobiae bacterium]|nr:Wzz/FepE/Etk N-terminal domain-containing protein [Verrucomicrobiae bacterium]
MNSASTPPNQPSDSPENEGAGLNLDDVLYTLFRHKWLLLGSFCMGIVAVFAVRIVHPPSFTSHTKLMIHYIEDRPPTPTSQDAQIRSPDADGPNLLNTEKELIRTLDVATNVAAMIGPERLLRNRGSNLLAAAGVVCGGLEVEVPFGEPILDVKFKSKQKELVQPVVAALIEAYKRKHQEVHGGGALDDFYRQEA